jgi:hypothetical protein
MKANKRMGSTEPQEKKGQVLFSDSSTDLASHTQTLKQKKNGRNHQTSIIINIECSWTQKPPSKDTVWPTG